MQNTFPLDDAFRKYIRLLLRHHYLLCSDRSEDFEMDGVEGLLSDSWERLSDAQQQEARGISSDLNWLRRGFTPPPKGKKSEEVTASDRQRFQTVVEAGEHVEVLRATRDCVSVLPAGLIAIARSRSYLSLDLPELAEPFLLATVDLSADRSESSRAAFVMLIHVNPAAAFAKAEEVIATPEKYPPVVVAFATKFFLDFAGGAVAMHELATNLLASEKRLEDEPTEKQDRIHFYSLGGSILSSLRMLDEGRRFFERGLELDPENAELLGLLGESLYYIDRSKAVNLFERAVAARTTLDRPYLRIAQISLQSKDYQKANVYAARAVDTARDNLSLAAALEIMAICLNQLGVGDRVVLALFERANMLAPSIPTLAYNLDTFKKYVATKTAPREWETEDQPQSFRTGDRWRNVANSEQFAFSQS